MNIKENISKNVLIGISIFLILLGFCFVFIDLDKFCIISKNDGFVAAFFSLAGVVLYFTALRFQIREYQLQVEELKKSVEAQTNTSKTLEEQKQILIEQNINNLLFTMINSFNEYKVNNEITLMTKELTESLSVMFIQVWERDSDKFDKINIEDRFIDLILEKFKQLLNQGIKTKPEVKRFAQFAFNILFIIESNKKNLTNDNIYHFFFNQLSRDENNLLHICNLISDFDMPHSEYLKWTTHNTNNIIEMLKYRYKINTTDFDLNKLTDNFRKRMIKP